METRKRVKGRGDKSRANEERNEEGRGGGRDLGGKRRKKKNVLVLRANFN
jgi:hypothetical protein